MMKIKESLGVIQGHIYCKEHNMMLISDLDIVNLV